MKLTLAIVALISSSQAVNLNSGFLPGDKRSGTSGMPIPFGYPFQLGNATKEPFLPPANKQSEPALSTDGADAHNYASGSGLTYHVKRAEEEKKEEVKKEEKKEEEKKEETEEEKLIKQKQAEEEAAYNAAPSIAEADAKEKKAAKKAKEKADAAAAGVALSSDSSDDADSETSSDSESGEEE